MSAPKIILAPTDFSEPADRALDYAIELARGLGAEVVVLHAYQIRLLDVLDGALIATEGAGDRIVHASQAALDAALAQRREGGVELSGVLREGEPRDTIHAVAEEVGADLIVIGTHGRRGLSRALLGSVAEYVVRTAVRPVLTVHGTPTART